MITDSRRVAADLQECRQRAEAANRQGRFLYCQENIITSFLATRISIVLQPPPRGSLPFLALLPTIQAFCPSLYQTHAANYIYIQYIYMQTHTTSRNCSICFKGNKTKPDTTTNTTTTHTHKTTNKEAKTVKGVPQQGVAVLSASGLSINSL